VPGDPGSIVNIPVFNFGVYAPGDLPGGTYHLGIACTLNNEVVTVWDTEIVVTEDAGDQPAQIRWQVAGSADGGSGTGGRVPVAAGAGLAVVAVGIFLVRRQRQQRPTVRSMEDR
jgi:hypothetical protein